MITEPIKTANQLYRESGTTLSFAEWVAQEKEKGVFIKNETLSKILEGSLINEPIVEKPSANNGKFLGLSKPVLVISAIIIISAIGYKIYSSKKS
jgi:hypothetical protein